jgi:hypothetical protein
MLPAEVNYVFFVVNARTGINTLAEAPGLLLCTTTVSLMSRFMSIPCHL